MKGFNKSLLVLVSGLLMVSPLSPVVYATTTEVSEVKSEETAGKDKKNQAELQTEPKQEATIATEAPATEPKQTEPKQTEPKQTEPKQTEPKQTEPKQTEPKQTEPKQTEPPATEPKQTEPKQREPKQTEPKQTEPKQTEPKEKNKKDKDKKEAKKKKSTRQTGTWGTAPWTFDEGTGTLTIQPGELTGVVGSPWYNAITPALVDGSKIKKIVLTGHIVAPKNSSALFSGRYLENLEAIVGSSNLDMSNVTTMNYMFDSATSLSELDVSKWNTSNVTSMTGVFYEVGLSKLDVSNWDTSKVTTMAHMFVSSRLTELDVSKWNTSQVTNMSDMFASSNLLTKLDVSKWNTSNVIDMSYVFYSTGLTELDVNNWNISKVTHMSQLFSDSESLSELDLSNWNTKNVVSMKYMFSGVALKKLTLGDNFKFKDNAELGAPIALNEGDKLTGNWIREDGKSKGYSPADFMKNYGSAEDLTAGTYIAEVEGKFSDFPEIVGKVSNPKEYFTSSDPLIYTIDIATKIKEQSILKGDTILLEFNDIENLLKKVTIDNQLFELSINDKKNLVTLVAKEEIFEMSHQIFNIYITPEKLKENSEPNKATYEFQMSYSRDSRNKQFSKETFDVFHKSESAWQVFTSGAFSGSVWGTQPSNKYDDNHISGQGTGGIPGVFSFTQQTHTFTAGVVNTKGAQFTDGKFSVQSSNPIDIETVRVFDGPNGSKTQENTDDYELIFDDANHYLTVKGGLLDNLSGTKDSQQVAVNFTVITKDDIYDKTTVSHELTGNLNGVPYAIKKSAEAMFQYKADISRPTLSVNDYMGSASSEKTTELLGNLKKLITKVSDKNDDLTIDDVKVSSIPEDLKKGKPGDYYVTFSVMNSSGNSAMVQSHIMLIGKVRAKYIDENDIEIADSELFHSDKFGDKYETIPKSIVGYNLKKFQVIKQAYLQQLTLMLSIFIKKNQRNPI